MFAHTLALSLLFIPTAASPTEPAYIYSPCVTTRGTEAANATLEAPAFDEKMRELGYKQVGGKWQANYKIVRAAVYRWVDEFGEAVCTVEITSPPH
jgi:hypothetical protein